MPKPTGLDILKMVMAERRATRIVFLAASPSDRELVDAVDGGAYGVMLKESAAVELIRCLQSVAAGHKWLPSELVDGALARARELRQKLERLNSALTPREREIMLLVSDGLSNKEVGRRLNITEGTVKVHLYAIYQKVAVNNRTTLSNIARMYRGSME